MEKNGGPKSRWTVPLKNKKRLKNLSTLTTVVGCGPVKNEKKQTKYLISQILKYGSVTRFFSFFSTLAPDKQAKMILLNDAFYGNIREISDFRAD